MLDPFRETGRSLVAQGADPRRAGQAAQERFGVPRTIGAWEALTIGLVVGILVNIGCGGLWPTMFGPRPASTDSDRIASAVRSVVPDADALSTPISSHG